MVGYYARRRGYKEDDERENYPFRSKMYFNDPALLVNMGECGNESFASPDSAILADSDLKQWIFALCA
jgi:hypothetical protein